MIIAYLINQYPQPSQTFVRREIAGVEAAGATVLRFTLRRFDGALAEPADQAERNRTRAVLDEPKAMALAVLETMLIRPSLFFGAARLMWQFHRASTRGVPPASFLAVPRYVISKLPLYLRFLVRPQKSWVSVPRDPPRRPEPPPRAISSGESPPEDRLKLARSAPRDDQQSFAIIH